MWSPDTHTCSPRGTGRKPGASLYTWKRVYPFLVLAPVIHIWNVMCLYGVSAQARCQRTRPQLRPRPRLRFCCRCQHRRLARGSPPQPRPRPRCRSQHRHFARAGSLEPGRRAAAPQAVRHAHLPVLHLHRPRRRTPGTTTSCSPRQRQYANLGISLPALSADALSATLYGHSTWRPLSCADRRRFVRNSVWAFTLAIYRNRPIQLEISARNLVLGVRRHPMTCRATSARSLPPSGTRWGALAAAVARRTAPSTSRYGPPVIAHSITGWHRTQDTRIST